MLTDQYQSLEDERANFARAIQIATWLRDKIRGSFPVEILAVDRYGFSCPSCVYGVISLPRDASEETTHRAVAWLTRTFGAPSRLFNKSEGYFYWHVDGEFTDDLGHSNFWVDIDYAHAGECKIIPVEVTKTVWVADCGKSEINQPA